MSKLTFSIGEICDTSEVTNASNLEVSTNDYSSYITYISQTYKDTSGRNITSGNYYFSKSVNVLLADSNSPSNICVCTDQAKNAVANVKIKYLDKEENETINKSEDDSKNVRTTYYGGEPRDLEFEYYNEQAGVVDFGVNYGCSTYSISDNRVFHGVYCYMSDGNKALTNDETKFSIYHAKINNSPTITGLNTNELITNNDIYFCFNPKQTINPDFKDIVQYFCIQPRKNSTTVKKVKLTQKGTFNLNFGIEGGDIDDPEMPYATLEITPSNGKFNTKYLSTPNDLYSPSSMTLSNTNYNVFLKLQETSENSPYKIDYWSDPNNNKHKDKNVSLIFSPRTQDVDILLYIKKERSLRIDIDTRAIIDSTTYLYRTFSTNISKITIIDTDTNNSVYEHYVDRTRNGELNVNLTVGKKYKLKVDLPDGVTNKYKDFLYNISSSSDIGLNNSNNYDAKEFEFTIADIKSNFISVDYQVKLYNINFDVRYNILDTDRPNNNVSVYNKNNALIKQSSEDYFTINLMREQEYSFALNSSPTSQGYAILSGTTYEKTNKTGTFEVTGDKTYKIKFDPIAGAKTFIISADYSIGTDYLKIDIQDYPDEVDTFTNYIAPIQFKKERNTPTNLYYQYRAHRGFWCPSLSEPGKAITNVSHTESNIQQDFYIQPPEFELMPYALRVYNNCASTTTNLSPHYLGSYKTEYDVASGSNTTRQIDNFSAEDHISSKWLLQLVSDKSIKIEASGFAMIIDGESYTSYGFFGRNLTFDIYPDIKRMFDNGTIPTITFSDIPTGTPVYTNPNYIINFIFSDPNYLGQTLKFTTFKMGPLSSSFEFELVCTGFPDVYNYYFISKQCTSISTTMTNLVTPDSTITLLGNTFNVTSYTQPNEYTYNIYL